MRDKPWSGRAAGAVGSSGDAVRNARESINKVLRKMKGGYNPAPCTMEDAQAVQGKCKEESRRTLSSRTGPEQSAGSAWISDGFLSLSLQCHDSTAAPVLVSAQGADDVGRWHSGANRVPTCSAPGASPAKVWAFSREKIAERSFHVCTVSLNWSNDATPKRFPDSIPCARARVQLRLML